MRHGPDNLSLSSGGNLSWSSGHDEISPREALKSEDIDHSISSLGPFIDLLFEKVELMPNNNLATNLLVTSLISQLVLKLLSTEFSDFFATLILREIKFWKSRSSKYAVFALDF